MRTWRMISLFAVLALVLAACGSSGTSPSAEESEGRLEGGEPAAEPSEGAGEPVAGGTLVFARRPPGVPASTRR